MQDTKSLLQGDYLCMNQFRKRVSIQEEVPVYPINALEDEAEKRKIEKQVPSHIKDLIARKFGSAEESNRIMLGYADDEDVRLQIDELFENQRIRAEKMVKLCTPQFACEE